VPSAIMLLMREISRAVTLLSEVVPTGLEAMDIAFYYAIYSHSQIANSR
jgi:hypothetical protein